MIRMDISYYSVVQYVPDPLRGERMNIGVVAADAAGKVARARFPGRNSRVWSRAKQFGREDLDFLRGFVESVDEQLSSKPSLFARSREWSPDDLARLTANWQNSIQFSQPKASTLSVEDLVVQVYERLVREPPIRHREHRDKRVVVYRALRVVRQALSQKRPGAESLVKSHDWIQGRLDEHELDLVVRNGAPLLAAEGLSFEVPASQDLWREMDALKWAIVDLREAKAVPKIGVIALPPRGRNREYERARDIYEELGAEFVPEPGLDKWAEETVARLPLDTTIRP